jgi:hypothetical protein
MGVFLSYFPSVADGLLVTDVFAAPDIAGAVAINAVHIECTTLVTDETELDPVIRMSISCFFSSLNSDVSSLYFTIADSTPLGADCILTDPAARLPDLSITTPSKSA